MRLSLMFLVAVILGYLAFRVYQKFQKPPKTIKKSKKPKPKPEPESESEPEPEVKDEEDKEE